MARLRLGILESLRRVGEDKRGQSPEHGQDDEDQDHCFHCGAPFT
jgi:hypothetical protein